MSSHRLLGSLTATAVSLGVAFGGAATAATVAFTSTASWSAGTGGTGCSTGCTINNNAGTSTYQIGSGGGNSVLSTTNFSSTFATDATGVELAAIQWKNAATSNTDQNFNALYNLTINFSQPTSLPADTTSFTLNVQQTPNPSGDILANLNDAIPNVGPFAFAGVTVYNIQWVLVSGSDDSTFDSATGTWRNGEGNTATLKLVADFKSTHVSVPEPASFAILGAGLLAFAAARRARRQV